jgi:hypothetical protein
MLFNKHIRHLISWIVVVSDFEFGNSLCKWRQVFRQWFSALNTRHSLVQYFEI